MNYPEQRKLFTMKEICHACGVSRTTLIRMEEDGFLKPYRVDPNTGYRYYDLSNVAAVGQYQRLQSVGLSRKEIADLYYERADSDKLLEGLRQKLNLLQRFLYEYELRHDKAKNYSFSYITLPSLTCYCAEITASSFEELETKAYLVHEKCVEEGYRILGSEPLMAMFDDLRTCIDPFASAGKITACIPVISDSENDPNLRIVPACEAVSILGFGEYTVIIELWTRLFAEIEKRGLEPAGPARMISLIAPYTGDHYRPDDYCYVCVVPIKEHEE